MEQQPATQGHNNPPSEMELLPERLLNKNAIILIHADDLVQASFRIPARIDDKETAGKAGDYIKQLTGCIKKLEAERVSEKEPFLSMGRAVDGFFKVYTESLSAAKARAEKPLSDYLRRVADEERRARQAEADRLRKEAEEQAAAAQVFESAKMQPIADKAMDEAVNTEMRAANMAKAAEAKPAHLAQSRGASGSLSSLRTRWVGEIIDRDALDLEKLRQHIPLEALQKAVNSLVAAGGRELAGATIYEKSEAVVR